MYVGHTSDDGRTQPLRDHLEAVAKEAARFAEPFGASEFAYLIGQYHDIGKYSDAAQRRLLHNGPKVDHATAGAQALYALYGPVFGYPIMGHHGGLPDGGDSKADVPGMPTFFARLKKRVEPYDAYRTEIPAPQGTPRHAMRPLGRAGFSLATMIRMLHSCVVDADFLDTETFMTNGAVRHGGYDDIKTLAERLDAHLASFPAPTTDINRMRNAIQRECQQAALGERGLYSLTVPTGGGKTLSSMAFALRHAAERGLQRVIYVIPYTSIIEQNAKVFADILGAHNVLEHHSGVEYQEDDEEATRRQLACENWDAPIVVTTNVQFFESLFSNKPSKCRKLHNIAGSVLVFDEAQMLPVPYLLPCVRAIAELVHNFGNTAVLCTATQPSLDHMFPPEVRRTEICRDPIGLQNFFRRTTIAHIGPMSDAALAERLRAEGQALCIVNTRKQAQALYGLLQAEQGVAHLSTLLYPEHRKSVLDRVRAQLAAGQPCIVISTSLIEAGVDVDFPAVYRAEAGLDSIIQAAGRCNREGKRAAAQGRVYVFAPDASYAAPESQRQPVETYRMTADKHDDVASLDAIRTYFDMLFTLKGDALDQKNIVERFEAGWDKHGGSFPFRTVAEAFRLIDSPTRAVLIPKDPEAAEAAARLRSGERGRALMRLLGKYSVNVYEDHFRRLDELGMVEVLDGELAILDDMTAYDDAMGLDLSPEGGQMHCV